MSFTIASPIAIRARAPRVTLHTSRASVVTRAASYDTLSGYQKNRMATAKTDADWAAIEKDIPGARAMYAAATKSAAAEATATNGKVDPMDALCASDPGAIECKAFD